jgi:hypothetical protein
MTNVLLTPRVTNNLYHYTGADVAIYNILNQGALRLSPYEFTNDPEENRPRSPTLSGEFAAADEPHSIWNEADWWLRRYVKVACFTQDFEIHPPEYATDRDALRGWGHPALWAHYGARHGGVCLRFDRTKIIEQFVSQMEPRGQCFHGPVDYPGQRFAAPPGNIDIEQAREFGVDAVTFFYIDRYHKELFFTKHPDWANEMEYRLVLNEASLMPSYLDISDCLTGIVLGSGFPGSMLDRIQDLRNRFPKLEVLQMSHLNGGVFLHPIPQAAARNTISARRSGTLEDRLGQLRSAEEGRKLAREVGEIATTAISGRLDAIVSAVQSACSLWANVEVQVYQRIQAVPPEQRGKRPGVPGEVVEFQTGKMCVVENMPKQSCTLIIALAVQLLESKTVRLYGLITAEKWVVGGNEQSELWQQSYESTLDDAASQAEILAREVQSQIVAAENAFNLLRSQ